MNGEDLIKTDGQFSEVESTEFFVDNGDATLVVQSDAVFDEDITKCTLPEVRSQLELLVGSLASDRSWKLVDYDTGD